MTDTIKIPETGTDTDFPITAVKEFSPEGQLLRVRDSNGRMLWAVPPKPMTGKGTRTKRGLADLPEPMQQAFYLLLDGAQFQTIRTSSKELSDFFHGYLAGVQQTLAIMCGALGYSLNFLIQEDDHDNGDSDSATSQPDAGATAKGATNWAGKTPLARSRTNG